MHEHIFDWMKFRYPVFHELTANILSYSWLVCCDFCFHIVIQPYVNQHINCVFLFLMPVYILELMLIWDSLYKYFHNFHRNSMCLISIYFSLKNLLDILLLSFVLLSLHSCFVSWDFRVSVSCVMFFLFQNHRDDNFSSCLLPILIPWVIYFFRLLLDCQSIC